MTNPTEEEIQIAAARAEEAYILDGSRCCESCGSGIFVRENGATNEITQEEWDRRLPGRAALIWREIRVKEVNKSIDDLKVDFVADLIMQEQRLGVRIDELEFQLKTLREERDAYRNVLKNSCFCWQEWNDNAPGPCNVCEVLSRFEKKGAT